MILAILLKNGNQIYEDVRTVEVDGENLVYYRIKFYAGEKHELNVNEIQVAKILNQDKILVLISN